jgi:hypothetical protein
MTRGIFSSMQKIIDLIQAINPKTESYHGFVCVNDGTGISSGMINANQNRFFQLNFRSLPVDDGQAGLSGRKRCTLVFESRYETPNDLAYLMKLISEDAALLIDTLKGPEYDFNTTGIISLIPDQAELQNLDKDGMTVGYVLTLPFDLLYMEE